jgi:transglutaminase-like putative cysteine protease
MVVAVALSIPLFALFPRVRNPVLGVRGVGTGTVIHAAGFTDDVTLDSIGAMRSNPEVAIRLRYPEGRAPDGELRLKGATFDTYKNRRWEPTPWRETSLVPQGTAVRLTDRQPEQWLDVWRQPMNTRSLFLPAETVALEVVTPVLAWDKGGAVSLLWGTSGVFPYRVGLVDEAVSLALRPAPAEREPALDASALTPRIVELAAEVAAGAETPAEVATRLERHLMDRYTYSESFVGLTGARPLEDFLFRHQQGHCELFASALVLMLRSQGIPARLVTGFLGAERNPLTGYYVVRQANAHAWVEAYLPELGWRTFDPTPPAGRPDADILARWTLFRQVSDFLQFRWDRYVLTYGFQDQLTAFWRLRSLLGLIRGWFGEGEGSTGSRVAQETGAGTATDSAATDATVAGQDLRSFAFRLFFVLLAVTLVGWLVFQHLRAVRTATEAFRRLRRQAVAAGIPLAAGTAPLEMVHRLGGCFPEARDATGRVVSLYLRESFGGYVLTDGDRRHLLDALRAVRRSLAGK